MPAATSRARPEDGPMSMSAGSGWTSAPAPSSRTSPSTSAAGRPSGSWAPTDFTQIADVRALLHAIAFTAARHRWSLQDLAYANVAKLSHRAERGVLQGAGECR